MNKDDFKGLQGLKAYTSFNRLLMGASLVSLDDYENFYNSFSEAPSEDKKKILQKAVAFVDLTEEEILSFLFYFKDSNGVTYNKHSIGSLPLHEIREKIIEVCMALSDIQVFF